MKVVIHQMIDEENITGWYPVKITALQGVGFGDWTINITGRWHYQNFTYFFESNEDAVAFKLRFL